MSDRLAEIEHRYWHVVGHYTPATWHDAVFAGLVTEDIPHLLSETKRLREALEWLVHLHHGISKGGNIEIVEEDVPYRLPYPVTDEEWREALAEAERVLEGKADKGSAP